MIRPILVTRSAQALLTASAVLSCAAPAVAQEAGSRWAFDVGAATDNRSKDASKSNGNPYVWGEALWVSGDGLFYAGPGFETIDSSTGSKLEVQAMAGLRPEIAGFDLDLKAAFKQQIDADPGTDDDAWEFTANLSRSIGPASARLQVQHSPDGTGSTKAWTWVETRLGWDLTNSLSATAAVGRREQDNAIDYTGWNAGLTWQVRRGLDADLRWYDTNADVPGEQYAGALVAAVSFAF
ncbi:MAG: porin [Brevundimonas sp.]|nr:porin [Brevundimonas sp.]